MKSRLIFGQLALCFLIQTPLLAINRPIHGLVTEGMTVTCDHQGMMLFREKKHRVAMKNISRTLSRTSDFEVVISNLSDRPINFYPESIHAVDQTGRVLEVVSKRALIAALKEKHEQRLAEIKKTYIRERGTLASSLEEAMANRILLEKGELPRVQGDRKEIVDAIKTILRRERELRYKLEDLPDLYEKKREVLLAKYEAELQRVQECYCEKTTVLPEKILRFRVQISLPRRKLKEMRTITVTLVFDEETYPFSYQVSQRHIRKS